MKIIESKGDFSFSRSGGPGGQNVNKVNTKVLLTLSLDALSDLEDLEIVRIKIQLSGRINSRGELFLQLQEERSQLMNRERAVEKMTDLILGALVLPRKRKKTKPSKAAKRRRLEGKKKLSDKKKNRGRPTISD